MPTAAWARHSATLTITDLANLVPIRHGAFGPGLQSRRLKLSVVKSRDCLKANNAAAAATASANSSHKNRYKLIWRGVFPEKNSLRKKGVDP